MSKEHLQELEGLLQSYPCIDCTKIHRIINECNKVKKIIRIHGYSRLENKVNETIQKLEHILYEHFEENHLKWVKFEGE